MKTTKIHDVYQLAFMPRIFPVNCYFVEEDDGLTLIDAALPYHAKAIMRAAESVGKPIVRIVLTHGHGDHVGALDALKRELPEAKVYISKRDARLLAGDRSLDADERQTPIRGDVPKKVRTRPDTLLAAGDRIGSLVAVSAPGHTPGLMAFQDTRSGAMIAGDAFQTRGRLAVSGQTVPSFPFPALATWSKQDALESARKLLACRPSLLAVGHGKMIPDPCAAIERAIREAESKLEGGRSHA